MTTSIVAIIVLVTLLIVKAIKFSLEVKYNHPNNLKYLKDKDELPKENI